MHTAPLVGVFTVPHEKSSIGGRSHEEACGSVKSKLNTWPLTDVTLNLAGLPRKDPSSSCTSVSPCRTLTARSCARKVAIAAASEGQVEVVNFLLTRAEDAVEVVNAANHDEETALIRATLGGHVDVVRALLATDGINVNAATSNGTTALMVAAGTDNEEIATELLVADGISVNAEDVNGKTALQHAIDRGNRGVATLIQTIMDAFDVDD